MWRLLWLANLLVLSRSELSCDDALAKCRRSWFECLPMLHNVFSDVCESALGFNVETHRVTGAMHKTCPIKCVKAIQNFTSSKWGKLLESCTCSDGFCMTFKARLKRCVLMNDKNYTIFSCTEARKRCTQDKYCKKTKDSFLRRCTYLISGVNCTKDCKDAQDDLLSSELGKALNDCECDGGNEHICRAIRAHYEELCKATRPPRNELSTPREQTVVKERQSNSGNTRFELREWLLYATIIAHAFVLYNR